MALLPAVVLDANSLVPAALRDTLLRLAEEPALYLPVWSEEILAELRRTLSGKLGINAGRIQHLEDTLRLNFPDSTAAGFERIIPLLTNHPKDRHVLAAAIKSGSRVIVTFNLRDFPAAACVPWGVTATGPGAFLKDFYHGNPRRVLQVLEEQGKHIGRTLEDQLRVLRKIVPTFVDFVCFDAGIALRK